MCFNANFRLFTLQTGGTGILTAELDTETRTILEYSVGSTLWLSNMQSQTIEVVVDSESPLISAITMIAPSPDFFSGFYDQSVLDETTDTWYDSFVIETYPWDAGTKSGQTYTANGSPEDPALPITFLTDPGVPDSAAAVFLNPSGTSVDPVARWECTTTEYNSPVASPVKSPSVGMPSSNAENSPTLMTPSVFVYDYLGLDPVGSPAALIPSAFAPVSQTSQPTEQQTSGPTRQPSAEPSQQPTPGPTGNPTSTPTRSPTASPTGSPTSSPTATPTLETISSMLGLVPPTSAPVAETTVPTLEQTPEPSSSPEITPDPTSTSVDSSETAAPQTNVPTAEQTPEPSASPEITLDPTMAPSDYPETATPQTNEPTNEQTTEPTPEPTSEPSTTDETTMDPTIVPTDSSETPSPLTNVPNAEQTPKPSSTPEITPVPSSEVTQQAKEAMPAPTEEQTSTTQSISISPTQSPSKQPNLSPTEMPSATNNDSDLSPVGMPTLPLTPSGFYSPALPLTPTGYIPSPVMESMEAPVQSPVHSQLKDFELLGWVGRGKGSFSSTMSRDGSTVAVAYKVDPQVQDSDHNVYVSVFRYGVDGDWKKIGNDLIGDMYGDEEGVGKSVALSHDGNSIAIGFFSAPCGRGIRQATYGSVSVHFFDGADWEKRGQDIFSDHPNDLSGYSLSMSDDGLRLLVGSPTNGVSRGQVRLFEFDPIDHWKQLAAGTRIEGDGNYDYFVSSDGSVLINIDAA
jgi:hypothetical protein